MSKKSLSRERARHREQCGSGFASFPGTVYLGEVRVWSLSWGQTAHGFYLACYCLGRPVAGSGGEGRRELLI